MTKHRPKKIAQHEMFSAVGLQNYGKQKARDQARRGAKPDQIAADAHGCGGGLEGGWMRIATVYHEDRGKMWSRLAGKMRTIVLNWELLLRSTGPRFGA